MKIHVFSFLALAALPCWGATTVSILKNGSVLDGYSYYGSVTKGSDGAIYGVSGAGGANALGVFFRIPASGTGFNASFDFATATGSTPVTAPIEASDGRMYGGTYDGGANGDGVVYSIQKDGSGYTVLRSLATAADGEAIYGKLIEGPDGRLYGTTYAGGTNNAGTIFRIRKDGTGFGVLRHLVSASDGANSTCGLVQWGDGKLYGATSTGGANSGGTIFSVNTDGTDFTVLKALSPATDGGVIYGSLLAASDGYIYGCASAGGTKSGGVAFKIKKDGTGYTKLYEFDSSMPGADNGYSPYAGLAEGADGRLYGQTLTGGTETYGTIYALSKTGSFTLLHTFTGSTGSGPGQYPYYSTLTSFGAGTFVGVTNQGGASSLGVVFKLTVTTARPTLKITTKPPKATSKAVVNFAGSASGEGGIASVQYSSGKGFLKAGGTTKWSFKARLKKGKNTFSIRAVDALGQTSAVQKVTVTKK